MLSDEEKKINVSWEYLLINLKVGQSNLLKISAKIILSAASAQKGQSEIIRWDIGVCLPASHQMHERTPEVGRSLVFLLDAQDITWMPKDMF